LFEWKKGVDFQIKTVMIDNRIIALSLWDTAGQERYRSITKQYFRKADGIICMYDVTSEQSYKNLRNWITSIKVI
jgi:small GTP-binding protein